MKTKYILFLFCIMQVFQMNSQTQYMTKDGHLKMFATINKQPVVVESHNLSVFLDYNEKQLNGILDLNTLINEIPELKNYLKQAEQPLLIQFSGTIPEDDFMSHPHQPLTFNWQVNVTFQNKNFKIFFKTTLEHIETATIFSCRLSTSGVIATKKLGLKKLIPGLGKTIKIQFIQVVLRV